MPTSHRSTRRDQTAELRRVGAVDRMITRNVFDFHTFCQQVCYSFQFCSRCSGSRSQGEYLCDSLQRRIRMYTNFHFYCQDFCRFQQTVTDCRHLATKRAQRRVTSLARLKLDSCSQHMDWTKLILTDLNKSTQLHDAFIGHARRRHDYTSYRLAAEEIGRLMLSQFSAHVFHRCNKRLQCLPKIFNRRVCYFCQRYYFSKRHMKCRTSFVE